MDGVDSTTLSALGLPTTFTDGRVRRVSKRPASPSASSSASSVCDEDSAAAAASSNARAADATTAEPVEHNDSHEEEMAFPLPPPGVSAALIDAQRQSRIALREARRQRKKAKLAVDDTHTPPVDTRVDDSSIVGVGSLIVARVSPLDALAAFTVPSYGDSSGDARSKSQKKNARKKKKRQLQQEQKKLDGFQHVTNADDIAHAQAHETEVKYWCQRYRLFTRFDEGCKLDRTGWFSVTPEAIAIHQAERCRCDTIIDAYAGVGGNTIQFAMTCYHVIAIEIDPKRLEILRNNARVYGVEDRIEFICGDYMTLIPKLKADVVFLAPPWGGVDYTNVDYFDIQTMIKPNGYDIFRATLSITSNIAYCLPRNILPSQVREMASLRPVTVAPDGQPEPDTDEPHIACELERNCISSKVKMMTAYYGQLVNLQGDTGNADGEEEDETTEAAPAANNNADEDEEQ